MTPKKGILILSGIKGAVKGADFPPDKLLLPLLTGAKGSKMLYVALHPG